jgi:predicted Zn finger-like uncharacterized protein
MQQDRTSASMSKSQMTQCPACGTCFRVVADQLRIADGWVRCGQCGEAFDARARLNEVTLVASDAIPEPDSPTGALSSVPHTASEPSPSIGEPEPEPVPSFVRQAQRAARWNRPWVRWGFRVLALFLALLLALQVAVQQRDRLAAIDPGVRVGMERLCLALGCTIDSPRIPDAVLIEASGIRQVRGAQYELRLALRNTAAVDVQMPWVELTLTDERDQITLRRVLSPQDLGAPRTLPAAETWSGGIVFEMAAGAGAARPLAGYRVLAFYL